MTSALQRVDFRTHLAITYQHSEDEFFHAGPSAWNSLPEHLRASDLSLNSFRHSLKTLLFTQMTQHIRDFFVIVGYTSLLFTFIFTVSDTHLYAVNFATELLCFQGMV